ncbi:hypothetical protein IFM12275_24170 [Nocardia sputorum]|nr:hypothetical protein IFM12275_24170 [Nocardia sputorum]
MRELDPSETVGRSARRSGRRAKRPDGHRAYGAAWLTDCCNRSIPPRSAILWISWNGILSLAGSLIDCSVTVCRRSNLSTKRMAEDSKAADDHGLRGSGQSGQFRDTMAAGSVEVDNMV